jgi:hypothetical protein
MAKRGDRLEERRRRRLPLAAKKANFFGDVTKSFVFVLPSVVIVAINQTAGRA